MNPDYCWTGNALSDPVAIATFYLNDGSCIQFENVREESISNGAANKNVIAVEFMDSDRVVHIPFVRYWEIDWR